MNAPESQTQMTNPPKAQAKMVKIRAKHPLRIDFLDDKGQPMERVINAGDTVEVTEAEAKEFCDKKISISHKGNAFGSFDSRDIRENYVIRAERVKS